MGRAEYGGVCNEAVEKTGGRMARYGDVFERKIRRRGGIFRGRVLETLSDRYEVHHAVHGRFAHWYGATRRRRGGSAVQRRRHVYVVRETFAPVARVRASRGREDSIVV